MTRKVAFSNATLRDLDEIFEYLAEQSQDLARARRLLDSILDHLEKIASFSTMFGRPRDELALGLRGFAYKKYVIYLRYEGKSLLVVNILHARRDAQALFGPEGGPSP
ncbi:type II toxin-antitoxin system RelE/ParE family toxin [Methylocystis bryophila]|uniref:Plasmid stabilization protein n=1 Tax=Methylocystis bryophila TaxID=655015 RepID=A0A1W6MUZ5_9HYPH|nr:type II toxin-antitoxin system RelE/ParE family toxin [Methylocystis bryophila]ARN81428.1 hypothetical protein B1812_10485 [Methylocystis bryophila]BDV37432.1 hypothetical protein DSM21852_06850 [Methylocystis bryophila]